jgi:hypothetical protein
MHLKIKECDTEHQTNSKRPILTNNQSLFIGGGVVAVVLPSHVLDGVHDHAAWGQKDLLAPPVVDGRGGQDGLVQTEKPGEGA